jgi:hypothetical protein
MEKRSLQVKKPPTAEYRELLKGFSGLQEGAYTSNIRRRDKALLSLAYPAMVGVGFNAYAQGGPLGYLAVVVIIALLSWLISRPDGHQTETEEVPAKPRVSSGGRIALEGT